MAKTTQATYNLDFKCKIGDKNVTLRDFGRYYYSHGSYVNSVIYDKYVKENRLNDLLALAEAPVSRQYWESEMVGEHRRFDYEALKKYMIDNGVDAYKIAEKMRDGYKNKDPVVLGMFPNYVDNNYEDLPTYYVRNLVESLLTGSYAKTPEYAYIGTEFKKWLKKRDGVKEAYLKHLDNKNKPRPANDEIELSDFTDILNNWDFKHSLEVNRPVVFKVGSLVCLRKNYHGTYRHDPYYYCRNDAFDVPKDQMPRMGIVSELTQKCASRSRYGKGSRLLKIMWSATGETSSISENKLIIAEKYNVGED